VDELFHAALERDTETRTLFLARACNGDDELLREVESMLAHHERAQSFMESPAYAVEAQALEDDTSETLKGRTVGSYEVLSELGQGGMGQVYLAFDHDLKRRIALKFLHAASTGDGRRLRRFQQEARAASALNHPNILTIYEIGEMDGRQFIATEFVEGRTLREAIRLGQMHVGQILDIAVQIGSALSAAHAVGVVHRDIKPENIMLRADGYIKIVDFGLAKLTEEQGGGSESTLVKTEAGVAAGTIGYMSPEQIRRAEVDTRTDIWSSCVVLYEMIEGRHPFQGETSGDMLANILRSEPPLLSHGSPELRKLIVKGLFKDQTLRYQTMNELLLDLRKIKSEMENRGDLRVIKGKTTNLCN
jgi:serine/threonine protein kinase